MRLLDIIKGTEYDISLFSEKHISKVEIRILEKVTKKGVVFYYPCIIRKKEIRLTPEEVIRQLYLVILTE